MATSKDFRVKNGLVVEQDISFGGSFKDLSGNPIELGGTSSDTYTVKDELILQQSETPIGTVVSKSIIPATTLPTTYTSNQTNNDTNPIRSVLNFNYAYFYNNYANIYSISTGNDKLKELFAIGNTVRITKDGFWWDLSITSVPNFNTSFVQPYYDVIGTNSQWSTPDSYASYWDSTYNISFSCDLPIAQKSALTLNSSATQLADGDKIIINGSQNDTPYPLSTNTIGTWGIGVTTPTSSYTVAFGSNTYYPNTQNLRDILQVGNTVTISDNNWNVSGVYLVTNVSTDTIWNSTYGFSVTLQYVSGTDYPAVYTNMASIFSSYFGSASATITPNYSTLYLDRFTETSGNNYITFDDYDFLNVGDVLQYIPVTTAVKFKDDAGNNIKAITYNNSTSEMTYDGIVQTLEYNSTTKSYWTSAANAERKASNISSNHLNVLAIGNNASSNQNSIAIGNNSNCVNDNSVSIGNGSYGLDYSISIGNIANAYSQSVAIGAGANSAGYASIAIGAGGAIAGGDYSVALGAGAYTSNRGQFSFASTGSFFKNQSTIIQWSNSNLTGNSNNYISIGNSTYKSSSAAGNSGGWFYLTGLSNNPYQVMALAEATVMYKPTQDANNDDVKVQLIKFVVRTTSYSTWVIDQLSTTDIFAGTGTLNSNWTTSFEIYGNDRLVCKVNKGTDSTAIGVCAKVEFKVLHTA